VQIVSVDEEPRSDQVENKNLGPQCLGAEWAGGDTYVRKEDGWTAKPVSLTKDSIIKFAVSRLDPVTGEVCRRNERRANCRDHDFKTLKIALVVLLGRGECRGARRIWT